MSILMAMAKKTSKILIGEAARMLGVSKRTLMRWDKPGKLPVERDPITNVRLYNLQDIRVRAHLRKLPSIRKRVDEFISTAPLDPFRPLKPKPPKHFEEMKKAFEELKAWEKKYHQLMEERAKAGD